MDWTPIIEGIMSGSPWALLIAMGWYHWRTRGQDLKVIAQKNATIEVKDAQIKTLNTEFKDTIREMGQHVENVMEKAHKEVRELQEVRVKETAKMQRQFATTMTKLDGTLKGLTTAVQSGGD